jgi:hypothetical protein
MARQIVADSKAGIALTPGRLDWARSVLSANALWKRRDDAHSLLNAAQAGEPVGVVEITKALRTTGDLGPRAVVAEAA